MRSRLQFAAQLEHLQDFYAGQEGLQRPGGMVFPVDGVPTCDLPAIVQWGYDLMAGEDLERIKAAIRQSHEWRTKHPGEPEPQPEPDPVPLVPITLGDWFGNFLYPAEHFFPPACCAFTPEKRAALFQWYRTKGYTHVLINAEQDDWGPSRGHPEWTAGGFSAYYGDGMDRLLAVLVQARRTGLTPLVGVTDQSALRRHGLETLVARTTLLVEATWEHVCLYMLSWELDDVFTPGDVFEDRVREWINSVNWHKRDVGIHCADGRKGGFNFYGSLPYTAVRLYQAGPSTTDADLEEDGRLCAEVHRRTATKLCLFEHTSPHDTSPVGDLAECRRRAAILKRGAESAGLFSNQFGEMNA